MTRKVITLGPGDKMIAVKEIFKEHKIHHLPVLNEGKVVGIVSKSDLLYFLRGYTSNEMDRIVENARLNAFTIEEIMSTDVVFLGPENSIEDALIIFDQNNFHCIPILREDELIGIVTTHDIIHQVLRSFYG